MTAPATHRPESSSPATASQKVNIAEAWDEALALWDVSATLSPPEVWRPPEAKSVQADEPLAYIDLETRQVVVNLDLLERMGALHCLKAVLAHEIGHHVRFPHSLGLSASLNLLEKRLIPGLGQSLTNLFFDLLVNEYVGRNLADDLCDVYKGFQKTQPSKKVDPLFSFYLMAYEELWAREPYELVDQKTEQTLELKFPGIRNEARTFVQHFYALPTVQQQFVYFCSRFIRYIEDPLKLKFSIPLASDMPSPDADDYDAAARGHASEATDEALKEARRRGWIKDTGLTDERELDPLEAIRRISEGLPGSGQREFRLALVSKHYKRLVDQHILKLPGVTPPPDATLPSILEDWEWGENPRLIDWTGTVTSQGPLAALRPQKRDSLPDEPTPREGQFPEVEIYLDTSGSMPDPSQALNTMTLAALILAASALRKGGKVRCIVYSYGRPLVSGWMSDEETARRFLLHYNGGGTDYPFAILKTSAKERDDVIRVIVSDSDFLTNVEGAGHLDTLRFGCERSKLLIAFLAASQTHAETVLRSILPARQFRLAIVKNLGDFAKAAASLADALMKTGTPGEGGRR
jgi:hypothetical protein